MTSDKKVYFGTKERMSWINAPAINVGRGRGAWTESGTMLNGGGYVLKSNYSHVQYTMNWPLAKPSQVAQITDYYDCVYGDGPFYYLDPFTMNRNLLPMNWAVPHLASKEAPPLILDKKPTRVTTPANTLDLPAFGAEYALVTGYVTATLYIPVPTGQQFQFGYVGSRTGTAQVTITPDTGSAVQVTPSAINATRMITTLVDNVGGGVTLSITGTGTLRIYGAVARVGTPVSATVRTNYFTNPRMTTSGSTFEARRNYATSPMPTTTVPYLWSTGTGQVTTSAGIITGASDGPLPGITEYQRRVITTAKTGGTDGFYFYTGAPVNPAVGEVGVPSIYVRSSHAATVTLVGSWRSSTNTQVGTTSNGAATVLAPGQWARLSTPPVTAATGAVQLGWWATIPSGSILPAGATVDVTAFLADKSSTLNDYFNGAFSQDSDYVPSWTGTANASASVLTGTRVASITGGIKSAQWSSPSLRVDAGQTATVTLGTAGTVFTALARNSGQVLTLGSTSVASTAAGQRVTVTSPTASTAVTFGPGWWDNAGTTSPYFDGATAASGDTTYSWTGATDASTSVATTLPALDNNVFSSGQGNSGMMFSEPPTVVGLSSAIREGLQSVSANLVEVGAWAP